jgi:integrase
MTRASPSTKSRRPRSIKARARLLAEIFAECSQGVLPGDYSEAAISDFAAELPQFYPTEATRTRGIHPPASSRAPSPSKMIEQAKAAGASITLPDGTKLDFSKRLKMGRQHIRDGVLTVKQQKTGKPLAIPVHVHLQAVLDATASEHLTFLVTATGKPYGGNAFSEQFRNWCDAAGLPKRCKPHGLRKAACRRLAEAGCSANEIMAISGHVTMKELVRYTAAADQARLAHNAMVRTMAAKKGIA